MRNVFVRIIKLMSPAPAEVREQVIHPPGEPTELPGVVMIGGTGFILAGLTFFASGFFWNVPRTFPPGMILFNSGLVIFTAAFVTRKITVNNWNRFWDEHTRS